MTFIKKISFMLLFTLSISIFNLSYADNTLPKFDCTLTDTVDSNDSPGDPKDTFAKNTPIIYLICNSGTVQKGQKLKAQWIAADTNNVAPANYKIDEKTLDVTQDVGSGQVFTANLSLSKPTNGWPAGSYHVDLYVNDQLAQSFKFSVKG